LVGHVEIHQKSSDWHQHQHQKNPAYNNVILHVVWHDDMKICTNSGELVPTLVLKNIVEEELLGRYHFMMKNKAWIPCEKSIGKVPVIYLNHFLERLLIERLQQKTHKIEKVLDQKKNDWEEAFYQFLCRSLGLKINAEAMFRLAQLLPQKVLAKHSNNFIQLEALGFGVAGFLTKPKDDYSRMLMKEYLFLKHKYRLQDMNVVEWKFLRLRPASFPTLRLAQLAALLHQHNRLFSKLLHATSIKEIETLFSVHTSDYWKTHYRFGIESKSRLKTIGNQRIKSIIINTLAPFYVLYSKNKQLSRFQYKSLAILADLEAENNTIVRRFEERGVTVTSSVQSQALLQLKEKYCDIKKCLNCSIGNHWINKC